MERRGKDLAKLRAVIEDLLYARPLSPLRRDHPLRGEWVDHRECHVEPNWLLVYRIEEGDPETLVLVRTGTHADLFE